MTLKQLPPPVPPPEPRTCTNHIFHYIQEPSKTLDIAGKVCITILVLESLFAMVLIAYNIRSRKEKKSYWHRTMMALLYVETGMQIW